jgi:hypothetical protein
MKQHRELQRKYYKIGKKRNRKQIASLCHVEGRLPHHADGGGG